MTEKKPLVLCVDDDPDVLMYLETVLEAEGFRYSGAESAEAGLAAYREAAPDAIILDLMMEEVDAGTGFARELQLLDNQAPIFLLSSVGDNLSLTTDYSSLGLAAVFQKPIDRERLLMMLRTALTRNAQAGA